jgi:hypothetical protein
MKNTCLNGMISHLFIPVTPSGFGSIIIGFSTIITPFQGFQGLMFLLTEYHSRAENTAAKETMQLTVMTKYFFATVIKLPFHGIACISFHCRMDRDHSSRS